ncbi:MAG: hypothetical protein GVY23_09035 [Spirochaetes bacterium]|jgi:hypothetical protein|nr:hypothetical protein [Spirochaetota bacterium]
MSVQISDTVLFRRYSYELLQVTTEEGLITPEQFGLMPEMMSTGCYRGFYLGYSLTKNGLFLRRMKVRDSRGHYPPIDGVAPVLDDGFGDATYRGLNVPVSFTGGMRVGRDPDVEKLSVYGSILPQVEAFRVLWELTLEQGRLVDAIDRSPAKPVWSWAEMLTSEGRGRR